MIEFIESLTVIQGDDDTDAGCFEATLYPKGTVLLRVVDEDSGEAVAVTYDLDEIARIHAVLGHYLWLGKHADE